MEPYVPITELTEGLKAMHQWFEVYECIKQRILFT